MEVKRFDVDGCADCPMQGDDHSWPTCGASGDRELPEATVLTWSGAPDWCPLRESSVLVTLRAKEAT